MKNCPRDKTLLDYRTEEESPFILEGLHFLICEECDGLWMQKDFFLKLAEDNEQFDIKEIMDKNIVDTNAKEFICSCPNSPTLTPTKINEVTINVCHSCDGIRFDGGDLIKILNGESIYKKGEEPKITGEGIKIIANLLWILIILIIFFRYIITKLIDFFS